MVCKWGTSRKWMPGDIIVKVVFIKQSNNFGHYYQTKLLSAVLLWLSVR